VIKDEQVTYKNKSFRLYLKFVITTVYVYLLLSIWQGYFRYAKAYYHLGFHDKAIAINIQAQTRCGQTTELIQQAAMFTKGNCIATQS
jgi:hypothetical protein